MTAVIDFGKGERITFSVPAEHIAKILATLTSARRDWAPSKWGRLAQLKITCKNGKKVTVDLHQTRAAIGAFSVHPDDRERNYGFVSHYFRGGSDEAFADAVQNAYERSKLE